MQNSETLKRYVLVITCSASFLIPFIGNAIYLAVPNIAIDYQVSAMLVSWVIIAYFLASAAFLLPFGRLADIIGRKKLFIFGHLLSVLASFLCAYAWSIQWLIAFRIIHGISAALILSTAMAILSSVFPPEKRGKVLGINSAVIYVGLTLSPVMGGFLTYKWGWASIFVVSGILSLILFILALTRLKGEWVGSPGDCFDWWGSVMYVGGLVAFLYGLSSLHEHWISWLSVLVGLMLLLIFVRHELRTDSPLLPLLLLKGNKAFTYANLSTLINFVATFAVIFLLSLYLQSILHFDAKTAGFFLLVPPVVMAIVSPFAGRLSDRMDARLISSWGMTICMLSLFVFVFLNENTPVSLIIANLLFSGLGIGLFAPPNIYVVMGSVEQKFYGVASSVLNSMRVIGQTISMVLASLVVSYYVGSVQLSTVSTDQLMTGIRVAFGAFTVICFFGVITSRQKEKPGKDNLQK